MRAACPFPDQITRNWPFYRSAAVFLMALLGINLGFLLLNKPLWVSNAAVVIDIVVVVSGLAVGLLSLCIRPDVYLPAQAYRVRHIPFAMWFTDYEWRMGKPFLYGIQGYVWCDLRPTLLAATFVLLAMSGLPLGWSLGFIPFAIPPR